MTYDLIIIGAGAAAASALITLQGNYLKIGVVAPSTQPAFKIGETLGPAGFMELQHLGASQLLQPEVHWPSFQKFSCWGSSQLLPSTSGGQQSWYLNRIAFEATLWKQALQTEADHFDAKVTHTNYQGDLWNIITSEKELQSRFLLDASGRSSIAGRHHCNRNRHDKLIALYTVLDQTDEEVDPTRATMIEARPEGWFYSVLIPGNRMVISWFTDNDLTPKGQQEQINFFKTQVHQSEYTLKRIETAGFELNNEVRTTDASTITTDDISHKNLILVGDAAVCFDPLSSHGITTALWSGRKSAIAFEALLNNDTSLLTAYSDSYRKGTEKYLQEKQQIYQLETRFRHEKFWQRRNSNS